MRKLFYFLSLGLLVTACHKDLSDGEGKENNDFNVPQDFDWATLQRENVELKETSSVYILKTDGEKTLLAEGLQAGNYDFTVGKGRKLEVVPVVAAKSVSRAGEDDGMIYFPSKTGWAMMMVEDVYPWTGDLDMNDVVFNFRLEYKMLDNKNVESLTVRLQPVALGGKQYTQIGVALQFAGLKDVFASYAKVSGQVGVPNEMFSLAANGTEEGNDQTIPLVGNLYDCFSQKEGCVNTFSKFSHLNASEIVVTINFDTYTPEYSQIQLLKPDKGGQNRIDLFVTFGDRGKEVHLKGAPQTAKIAEDFKKYASYCSPERWVWALILENVIKYPEEGNAIYEVYPLFKDWANGKIETEDEWTYDHTGGPVYIP